MAKKKKPRSPKYKRKVNTREVKQRFLIVCEGTKTEPNYFRSFRVPRNVVEVNVTGLGRNPSQLVDYASQLNDEDGDYDRVWCVFDRDSWKLQDFNSALSSAKNKRFEVAYSNPKFELWYLLHFDYCDSSIPPEKYNSKLSSYMGIEYEKNNRDMYELLRDTQKKAIERAEKLLEQYDHANPAKDNPSTTVHQLVKALNKFL
ncbi:RloB family protein [Roseofilum sp. BLCC_M91]|uniref:RloB family protein n=1 Tax=Roseofilum halophilum BLCC-M91 TaxID=3022259 RepID=A0ABT7BRP1_9CYAN|nr:RloB family protein [Roseofilum halophilum]MDJ1181174.1 RloB family protein [Roseofilum halophilum BLCC-M91]